MAVMFRDDLDEDYLPDGTVTRTPVRRWTQSLWSPLEIKSLFTAKEWSVARTEASDVFESLTLVQSPIAADVVVEHLRALVGQVLTSSRFTEITGLTP